MVLAWIFTLPLWYGPLIIMSFGEPVTSMENVTNYIKELNTSRVTPWESKNSNLQQKFISCSGLVASKVVSCDPKNWEIFNRSISAILTIQSLLSNVPEGYKGKQQHFVNFPNWTAIQALKEQCKFMTEYSQCLEEFINLHAIGVSVLATNLSADGLESLKVKWLLWQVSLNVYHIFEEMQCNKCLEVLPEMISETYKKSSSHLNVYMWITSVGHLIVWCYVLAHWYVRDLNIRRIVPAQV